MKIYKWISWSGDLQVALFHSEAPAHCFTVSGNDTVYCMLNGRVLIAGTEIADGVWGTVEVLEEVRRPA